MQNLQWRVRPAPYRGTPISSVQKPDMEAWGCGAPALAFGIMVAIALVSGQEPSFLLFLLSCIPVAGIVWYLYEKRLNEAHQARIKSDKEHLVRTAQYATEKAYEHLQSARKSKSRLQKDLDAADLKLSEAEREFKARAFGPFWDAVEQAALSLESYRVGLGNLEYVVRQYESTLRNHSHTFPSWQFAIGPPPGPSESLGRLKTVVRDGQTDFEFANIFEHRRTRDVLISGFEHLGAALDGLGDSVIAAIDRLNLKQ